MNPVREVRPDFEPFPKIGRMRRECIVTEKLDGTNAQILITEGLCMYVGSRNRWISPNTAEVKNADNFGFAAWVRDNETELMKLGPGRHFGEWWGSGIQRGYDMTEKRFSLFNVARWFDDDADLPDCVHTVPLMHRGAFTTNAVDDALTMLAESGSLAAPGYMAPEGIVVYHPQSRQSFKITLDGDGHKGQVAA